MRIAILRQAILAALLLAGLVWTERYSFLLFHCLAELISVIVAVSAFAVAWNARRYQDDSFLIFLGMALLTVGALDLVHTLSYQGMGVFPGVGANPSTQLWLAGRYLAAVSFLLAPALIGRRIPTGLLWLSFAGAWSCHCC